MPLLDIACGVFFNPRQIPERCVALPRHIVAGPVVPHGDLTELRDGAAASIVKCRVSLRRNRPENDHVERAVAVVATTCDAISRCSASSTRTVLAETPAEPALEVRPRYSDGLVVSHEGDRIVGANRHASR
jgi:hypothetical protein